MKKFYATPMYKKISVGSFECVSFKTNDLYEKIDLVKGEQGGEKLISKNEINRTLNFLPDVDGQKVLDFIKDALWDTELFIFDDLLEKNLNYTVEKIIIGGDLNQIKHNFKMYEEFYHVKLMITGYIMTEESQK